ncbi:MAG TPA: phage tail sheath C-terminal domain-containing protein [Thermomicrobiales bacterium]|nr:phage tail sheath C-terminal domain-containing protein [Thermomicrobiales bacterium]
MPVTLSYPGVYIEEIPSGVRAITGVATSIAAFVGAAPRGPLDDPTPIGSFGDYERRFGGLAPAGTLGYAVRDFFLNGGGQAVVVRVANGAAPALVAVPDMPLVAASPGGWGNALAVTVEQPADPDRFNLVVTEAGGATERHLNLSVDPADARFVARVLEQASALVRVRRNAQGAFEVPNARPAAGTTAATADSGGDGAALTAAQFTGDEANKTGIFALEKTDLFNLLCLPPPTRGGDMPPAVYQAALAYCVRRRAMLLVDPPAAWSATAGRAVQDAAATLAALGLSGTAARNAALYFPRVLEADPLREGQPDVFAPCGVVAGVLARTDAQRGVWKAPAGIDAGLAGVQGLETALTDGENGSLNQLGINCLRTFPVAGRVVWGARTLRGADQAADEYKYVPVRRLALFIEESLYRGTQWVVFEPNDEPLWAQIRLNIGAFLQNLFRQGAFQGTTPREAYFVKCDKETTTQNDINLGIVNILVGFAPVRPAEFVVIRIQQLAGQVA